ncbi:zinc-binding dehydrogenase [Pseudofrankia sp. BMG5.37]|uniref:zinc-binding dehydrogenase n=1 Tax=Pseudofrankia sp. BMG5.37 TaxID=3050035 RepID=UPI0028938FDF|nr:zinc-binding dehydrogenase [Pseudofrankia sp. BMG5.37]MDT3444606.1 zinc-binding dehydrogenase [Pseudofrankia sp. BMG5.37]
MRAIEVARFGGTEVLVPTDLPDPVPGPGEVLLAVTAIDVMFVDILVRSGLGKDFFPIRPPYVPGNGVGGQVVSVGDGVEDGWLGRRVIAHTGGPGGWGGYAERAVAPADELVAVPDGVDPLEAVAVLHDGPTALRIVELARVEPGQRVLVLGAAGAMGILLVQLLRARGARVVGAARGKAKLDAVAAVGAEAVVDYSLPGWTDQVLEATSAARPDVVLDGVGGTLGLDAYGLVADGGHFSAHGTPSGSFAQVDPDEARRRAVTITGIGDLRIPAAERTRLARDLLPALGRRLHPVIGQTFPLDEAARAHAALENRDSVAKTVLTVG